MSVTQKRMQWMDALRGAAILLVVHYHVVATTALLSNSQTYMQDITRIVGPLRMPILVLLSGFLVAKSVSKGANRYFSGKVRNILHPFIVWTIITYFMVYAKTLVTGSSSDISILHELIQPESYLWFLHHLMIYYVIFYFANKVHYLFPFLLSVALYVVLYNHGYNRFLSLFAFFSLGTIIGRDLRYFEQKIYNTRMLYLFILSLFAIAFSYLNYKLSSNGSYEIFYILSALTIIPVVIRAFMKFEGSRVSSLLEQAGKGSIVIYLVHIPILTLLDNILKIMTAKQLSLPIYGFAELYVILFFTVMAISLAILNLANRNKYIQLFFSAKGFFENKNFGHKKLLNS